ncbi:GNAT family N-acetyltransferase [Breznakiella homolactica]|uniref:GNAT family N-acetyltransferase n=1 Tax=Breznakiella homolactica TaxID=2798577 RepID=A0A7T8BCK4_9SPIR|nr:GNAT family N-acetyltransferase [Breznakiella homolactica]QQO10368.1 GNAT family N-acetyltransferase [Breznakiella homolactica]
MKCKLYKRPGHKKKIISEIVQIINELTGTWFTKEIPELVPYDLYFQDLFVLLDKKKIQSFIIFSSFDGNIVITLMATRLESRSYGYGTKLYKEFEKYIRKIKFKRIMVQTVPEESNSNYKSTISFYKKQGFEVIKMYKELWESGAIELEKVLNKKNDIL